MLISDWKFSPLIHDVHQHLLSIMKCNDFPSEARTVGRGCRLMLSSTPTFASWKHRTPTHLSIIISSAAPFLETAVRRDVHRETSERSKTSSRWPAAFERCLFLFTCEHFRESFHRLVVHPTRKPPCFVCLVRSLVFTHWNDLIEFEKSAALAKGPPPFSFSWNFSSPRYSKCNSRSSERLNWAIHQTKAHCDAKFFLLRLTQEQIKAKAHESWDGNYVSTVFNFFLFISFSLLTSPIQVARTFVFQRVPLRFGWLPLLGAASICNSLLDEIIICRAVQEVCNNCSRLHHRLLLVWRGDPSTGRRSWNSPPNRFFFAEGQLTSKRKFIIKMNCELSIKKSVEWFLLFASFRFFFETSQFRILSFGLLRLE